MAKQAFVDLECKEVVEYLAANGYEVHAGVPVRPDDWSGPVYPPALYAKINKLLSRKVVCVKLAAAYWWIDQRVHADAYVPTTTPPATTAAITAAPDTGFRDGYAKGFADGFAAGRASVTNNV